MHSATDALRTAWETLLELGPYFFLALFIAASVDMLYLDVVAKRSFKKHGLLGVLFTTCLGAFSPFCSFTVIPLIRKLLRGGVPLSAVMSFWIASPAMDPPIFALTARQIGLPLAFARLIGALILALGAGVLLLILEKRGHFKDVLRPVTTTPERVGDQREAQAVAPVRAAVGGGGSAGLLVLEAPLDSAAPAVDGCAASPCGDADGEDDDGAPWWPQAVASLKSARNWRITGRNFVRDGLALGKWLVFACVFEGVIRVYVPTRLVTDALGGKGWLLAIPLAVLISIPLYLNGIGAIPIVGGLLAKGMAQGAAVTFLLAGSITTIPAMVAVRSVVNNKVFAFYLGFGVVGSMLLGVAAQFTL